MKKVSEVKTIKEGIGLKEPFVIRELNLPCDLSVCKQRAAKKDIELFGYDKNGEEITVLSSKALSDFENGIIEVNIVDAPFPVLLNSQLPKVILDAVKKSKMGIQMTLTKKGTYTPLHADPRFGGGFMYLQTGIKKWQLILSKYSKEFKGTGKTWTTKYNDPPKDFDADILLETTINGGDFIYFPPGTLHRVYTYENSFGVSGYAKFGSL